MTVTQLGVAYVTATTAACATAIGLKHYLMKRASPLMQVITAVGYLHRSGKKKFLVSKIKLKNPQFLQRYVPFAAVAAANCVNIPLMRQNEIRHGIEVYDENEKHVGESRVRIIIVV